MNWSTSDRRQRLPADWPARVKATRDRAGGRCEADEHDSYCDGAGSECDHHQAGDDHSLQNLRWLNHWCHQAKTEREKQAALETMRAKLVHPSHNLTHPGLL